MPHAQGQLQHEILSRILAVARHLSASADLRDILNVIIDAMRDTLAADRATVFEYDAKTNELFTTVAHGVAAEVRGQKSEVRSQMEAASGLTSDLRPLTSEPALREIRIPATAGLAGECAQTRRIINVPDAYADRRFNQSVDRQTGYRTRSILTIPLLGHDGELVGVAQVLNKRGGPFTAEDEEIAQALAAQAAVAMKRGRLIEDRLMREKLERDLQLARTIQQSSFPDQLPILDGYSIAAWNEPADQTGGDVYDVIVRDLAIDRACVSQVPAQSPDRQIAKSPDHELSEYRQVVFLMADATGHGVGPALSVTQLRSMLRMAVRLGADLEHIAHHANQQLCADLPPGRFITAWLGELNAADATLTSLSAGQAPLLRYSAAADRFESAEADAMPLGVLDLPEFTSALRMQMHPGDVFAVISDGIFEARDTAGEDFGAQRVMQSLHAARRGSAHDMIAALRADLDRFTAGQPAQDDCTAIVIKRDDAGHRQ